MVTPWQRLEDLEVVDAGYQKIVRKQFRRNSGEIKIADVASPDGVEAAFVIALTPDRRVILARQFRCGPERVLDELPGGLVDPGEALEQAALRELREEVNYTSHNVTYLGKAYSGAWENLTMHYFLALDCYPDATGNSDADEEIEVVHATIAELIENARSANMVDIQAVFFAYDKLKELEANA